MTTHADVMRAIEHVVSREGEYEDTGSKSASADRQRWDALQQVPGDRWEEAVATADARVAETNAAANEAYKALGRAVIEMQSLDLDAQRNAARLSEVATPQH